MDVCGAPFAGFFVIHPMFRLTEEVVVQNGQTMVKEYQINGGAVFYHYAPVNGLVHGAEIEHDGPWQGAPPLVISPLRHCKNHAIIIYGITIANSNSNKADITLWFKDPNYNDNGKKIYFQSSMSTVLTNINYKPGTTTYGMWFATYE